MDIFRNTLLAFGGINATDYVVSDDYRTLMYAIVSAVLGVVVNYIQSKMKQKS